MQNSATSPAFAGLWILGPRRDLLLFILTPLLIIPIGLAAKGLVPVETLSLYVLGLGGFGHHLPGFIRAYSDPDLFHRFKLRFTLVPALLISTCALYSYLNLNALVCATVAWGTWHGAMQINGFMRIYDSKVKSFRLATARLDAFLCVAWFGAAILHSPAKQFSLITQFYASGGPLITPAAFGAFRWAWDAATAVITLLFLANAYRQMKAGSPPSAVKFAVMVSSFAFWWYCTVALNNLVLGIVLWEIFHDVQYNALVWIFERQRVDRDFHVGAAEKLLFGRGPARLACYALLILAYGSIGTFSSFGDFNIPERAFLGTGASQWLLRITIASALLHFYFDGFIWRVRERSTRLGLGLKDGEQPAADPKPAGVSRHGWLWALFILPVAALGLSQYRGGGANFDSQVLNLAEAIPGSWMANFLSGTYYKGQGRFDQAEVFYRRTVAANPDFAMGHLFLGDILYKRGNLAEALEQYRLSVAADSTNVEGRMNLGFLYLADKQYAPAIKELQAASAMDPANADLTFGVASAFLQQGMLPDADAYLKKTLLLNPNHSGALNYSGVIHEASGDTAGALDYYRQAIAADTSNSAARGNLATALSRQKPGPTPR